MVLSVLRVGLSCAKRMETLGSSQHRNHHHHGGTVVVRGCPCFTGLYDTLCSKGLASNACAHQHPQNTDRHTIREHHTHPSQFVHPPTPRIALQSTPQPNTHKSCISLTDPPWGLHSTANRCCVLSVKCHGRKVAQNAGPSGGWGSQDWTSSSGPAAGTRGDPPALAPQWSG